MENYQIGLLNEEQIKRTRLALEKVVMAAASTGSKCDFALRIYWPRREEEIITLEKRVKELPRVLMAAILKAEREMRIGTELDDLFGQLSLSSGNRAEERDGATSGDPLLLSSVNSLRGRTQDDEHQEK
jgi:hypothetical protein